jgi:putative membrane protein
VVFAFQVLTLLAMGIFFWWPVFGPYARARLSPLAGIAYLFTACLGCTVLGIYLTFAPVGVCSVYAHPVDRLGILSLVRNHWGLSPALDQQVGGLIMWVPACSIYLTAILALLARWYGGAENRWAAIGHRPISSQSGVPVLPEASERAPQES